MSEAAAPKKSLKTTLYLSHLSIAAGATLLLVGALLVTHALRARALNLATRSGPLTLAAKAIQASLNQAEAELRGWMALGEPQQREGNRAAWRRVYEELAQLESLGDGTPIHDQTLPPLRRHLLDLEEWHWYISDVSRSSGNEPARHSLQTNVAPVRDRCEAILQELIAKGPAPERLALLSTLQTAVLRSSSALQEFVHDGRSSQERRRESALAVASKALGEMLRERQVSDVLDGELAREIKALRVYGDAVVELRRRDDWNVSHHWLANESRVHEDAAHKLLDQLLIAESEEMERDGKQVVLLGEVVPPITIALLFAMLGGALFASLRAARRITEPVLALEEASRLLASGHLERDIPIRSADEIGSLTASFNAMRATLLLRHGEVKDSQARLEATFTNVVDALITIDERGTVESMNPAGETLFGVTASDAVGRNVRELMPEPFKSEHDGYLKRYLETNDPRVIGIGREVVAITSAGHEFPAELSVSEMRIGGERKFTGLIRDITERKRVDRLKTEFVSVVSHELRTPLTSIRGSLGLMSGGALGQVPDTMKSMVDIAVRSTDRLIRLINDILDIEKIESGSSTLLKELLKTRALFQQAMAANAGFAEQHGVTLDLQDQSISNAQVEADRDRMMQVLTNLISNAVKFSPEGGVVELKVERVGPNLRFSVSDHGPGIPEEFQHKLFQKFTQADSSSTRQQGGTGLGLSISRAIVELHGGTLSFLTAPGEGTTFFFELPEQIHEEATAEPLRPANLVGTRVLVCEDDPDVGTLLCVLLEQEGLVCDLAPDAESAKASLSSERYAALFLDLNLPGQDGLSLIKELRSHSRTADLPIVVVSAVAKEGEAQLDGSAFRVVDWISKPIDTERLKAAVGAALELSESGQSILYVEDDPSLIELVPAILTDGMKTELCVARTVAEGRALLAKRSFDLALLDIDLPDGSGLDLIPLLSASRPGGIPILVFSAHAVPPEYASQVAGTLLKSQSGNETLVASVRALLGKM